MLRVIALVLLWLVASPVLAADQGGILRLLCRGDDADNPAGPLRFLIDWDGREAVETESGVHFGLSPLGSDGSAAAGLTLWEAEAGPEAAIFRIAPGYARYSRIDKKNNDQGRCETEPGKASP